MTGIKGLTKGVERARRLPIIGKLRKGAARTEEDIEKKRPGRDLEWFRLTSDEPGLEKLFRELFGEDPAIITGVLPMATADECFPNRCEGRDKQGFLEHACDGEWCSIWRDEHGVYHYAAPGEQGPPCPGGCKPIGRLYLEIPELLRRGYSGWIVAETRSKNDIPVIYDALCIIAEKRRGTMLGLRGVPVIIRRVPAMIPTPRADGRKVRQEKWLVQLLESPEWAARQAELARDDGIPVVNTPPPPDWEEANHPGRTVAEVERDEFLAGEPDAENGDAGGEAPPTAEAAPSPPKSAVPRNNNGDNGGDTRPAALAPAEWLKQQPKTIAACREAHSYLSAMQIAERLSTLGVDPAAGPAAAVAALNTPPAESPAAANIFNARVVDPQAAPEPWDEEPAAPAITPDMAGGWLAELQDAVSAGAGGRPPSDKMVKFAIVLLNECFPQAANQEARDLARHDFLSLVGGEQSLSKWSFAQVKALIDALTTLDDGSRSILDPIAAGYVRQLLEGALRVAGQMELPLAEVA